MRRPSPPFWPRGYVERDGKALKPTALGEVTTKLMEEQFPNIVDVKFTANMEKSLDEVEEGKTDWVQTPSASSTASLTKTLEQAEKNMEGTRVKVPDEETDVVCELCGRKMVIKIGPVRQVPGLPRLSPSAKTPRRSVQETGGICPGVRRQDAWRRSPRSGTQLSTAANTIPHCAFMTWDKPIDGEMSPSAAPPCSKRRDAVARSTA